MRITDKLHERVSAPYERIGFRAVGRVWHLVDRIDG
jgi:hypothetical protein